MRTLFVDNLTVIDCSVLDPVVGLTGASWIVDLELSGKLDGESMLIDFGLIKKQAKQLIDDLVDHKLVVPTGYRGCKKEQKRKTDKPAFYRSRPKGR